MTPCDLEKKPMCFHELDPIQRCGCKYTTGREGTWRTVWCGDHLISENVQLLPCEICEPERHKEALALVDEMKKKGCVI